MLYRHDRLLTPCVALGIQWITALCDGPATWAIIDLINLAFMCVFRECQILINIVL